MLERVPPNLDGAHALVQAVETHLASALTLAETDTVVLAYGALHDANRKALSVGDNLGCHECQKCHVLFAPASTTVVAPGAAIFGALLSGRRDRRWSRQLSAATDGSTSVVGSRSRACTRTC